MKGTCGSIIGDSIFPRAEGGDMGGASLGTPYFLERKEGRWGSIIGDSIFPRGEGGEMGEYHRGLRIS